MIKILVFTGGSIRFLRCSETYGLGQRESFSECYVGEELQGEVEGRENVDTRDNFFVRSTVCGSWTLLYWRTRLWYDAFFNFSMMFVCVFFVFSECPFVKARHPEAWILFEDNLLVPWGAPSFPAL